MLHDTPRSRRQPRQTGSAWHLSDFGTTAIHGSVRVPANTEDGTVPEESREPEQSRYGVDTARPPPLAPGLAKPGRLLRGHRRASAPGAPAQPRTAGTPGPWALTRGRATRPIALEAWDGGIRRRRIAPRPERRLAAPPERGAMRPGLEANSRIRDLATFLLRVISAEQIQDNTYSSLPSRRCPTSETAFVG